MSKLSAAIRTFAHEDEGATMVEYGVMVALIAALCVAVIKGLGTKVNAGFETTNTNLP